VPPSETERDLQRLESELKRLEAEYNMFFAGRLPKPPWETRARVDALVKQYDRTPIRNTGERFRFESIQSRYASLVELWDRGLRSREEGRGGPFGQTPKVEPRTEPKAAEPRVLNVSSFKDPMQEMDKLHTLHDSLVEARREVGMDAVPFDKFAELVQGQVKKLTATGEREVAFRVAVKDGKVNFTARAMKTEDD
jgi:hypothetical protein